MWILVAAFVTNFLLQTLQRWFLSPTCDSMCRLRSSFRMNFFEHMWQVGISRWRCINSICSRIRVFRLNCFPHKSQFKAFSPVWWNMWAFNCVFWIKLLPHILQTWSRRPVCCINDFLVFLMLFLLHIYRSDMSVERLFSCKSIFTHFALKFR